MKTAAPKKDPRRYLRLRIRLVALFFAAGCAILLARAVDLQVFKQEKLSGLAQREFMKQVEIAPRRGIIFDRNQEELAVSLDTDSVYARPVAITTPTQTGRALAKILDLNQRKLIKRLRGERGFVWVARRIAPEQAEKVRELDLKGVGLVKEPKRFYPLTTLACHVLGFAGLDAKGLEGVERGYDKVLKGQAHTLTSLRDALGRTIHLTPAAFTRLPEGNHLILTLDKGLQYRVEKILAKTVERYKAKAAQAVVLIPQTGEILAMASVPAFNPNVYSRYDKGTYRNRNITDTFEPGSTFKVFVAAAALRSDRVTLEELFDCEDGAWKVGGRIIHDTHEYQRLNLADIVKYSSNIGAAKVGGKVGAEELHQTLLDFGFGKPTGVDLPGESRGILRPAASWRPVELANICFGQGVAVTPLQMAQAVAAVANGGVVMRPYVVRAEVDEDARLVAETHPQMVGRVLSAKEARLLTEMMVRVTEEGGTGTRARVEPYRVAGKTGTAQKVKPGGGYSQRDFIGSFVGFLPAEDPKVVVLVLVDTPRGQHYGGTVAGPAFAQIARAALETLGEHHAPPFSQLVKASQPSPPSRSASAGLEPSQALVQGVFPDLRGLSLREVLRLGNQGGFQIQAQGWGRVVAQNPDPGSPLDKRLSITLAPAEGGA